jgi:23S rRNA pseudouridine2605 synthase
MVPPGCGAPLTVRAALKRAGYATAEAESVLAEGLVTIDGAVAAENALVFERCAVAVNGVALRATAPPAARVFAYNKPAGVPTDASAGTTMRAAGDAMALSIGGGGRDARAPLQPVGQLDKNTTGLMVFTDSGDISNWINLPGMVPKTYEATYIAPAGREPTEAQRLAIVLDGVDVTRSGKRKRGNAAALEIVRFEAFQLVHSAVEPVSTAPAAAGRRPKVRYRVRCTLRCGRNHVVKRVLHAAGLPPVHALHRVAVGSLSLGEAPAPRPRGLDAFVNPPVGGFVELAASQCALLGVPSEGELDTLRRCQLLCRFRSALDAAGVAAGASLATAATPAPREVRRLRAWLDEHHTLSGPCFAAFPALACRGGATKQHALRWSAV